MAKFSGAATEATVEYTATYLVFTHGSNSREVIRRRGQLLHRGCRKSPAQLCKWRVTVHIQSVTKLIQELAVFQPESFIVNS